MKRRLKQHYRKKVEDNTLLSIQNEKVGVLKGTDTEIVQTKSSSKEESVQKLLDDISKNYSQEKFDVYFENAQNEMMQHIIKPFGLGKVLFEDRDGGNVSTVHNANKKIYARKEDEYNRKEYTNSKNSHGQQFSGNSKKSIGSSFTKTQMDRESNVVDAYTGKIQKASTTSPDHVESLSQYHKDGGFMQNSQEKADFATDKNNLAVTDRSVNQSMRDYDKKEWAAKEASEGGVTNKDKYNIDEQKLDQKIMEGKKAADHHLPSNMQKGIYYSKNAVITGVKEGAKMGIQQALGLFLQELITAFFSQAKDIYKNSFKKNPDDTFFETVLLRLKEVADSVVSKWKQIYEAFKEGAVSGFISNLVTTLINLWKTTYKRVVRMIREGIMSLIKAVRFIMNSPKGMSKSQVYHEASKMFTGGVFIGVGIVIEEAVSKFLAAHMPFLNNVLGLNLNEVLSTILVSTGVTVLTGLTVFLIDKLDIFGAERELQFEHIVNKLDEMTQENIESIKNNYAITLK